MPFNSRINWKEERNNIIALGAEGKTLKELGLIYGVSRQRIKQVCDKLRISSSDIGVGTLRKKREALYRQKWGNKTDTDLYREQRAKFRVKKANVLRTGTIWDINFGDLDWPTHCPILGIPIDYFSEGRSENSCSFDKLDPDKGYIKGNVIIVSWRANRIKNDGTKEEHQLIVDFLSSKGL